MSELNRNYKIIKWGERHYDVYKKTFVETSGLTRLLKQKEERWEECGAFICLDKAIERVVFLKEEEQQQKEKQREKLTQQEMYKSEVYYL